MKLLDLIPKLKLLQKYIEKPEKLVTNCGANNIRHIPIIKALLPRRNTLKFEEVVNIFLQTNII